MLAHRVAGGPGQSQRRVRGLLAGDHLEQAHDRRRIEEVHADDPLGALGSRGDRRDQQRRGVARQHALVGDDAVRQPREQLVLELQALGRRLDHQLARGKILERGSRLQPVASRRRLRIAQSATLDAPVQLGPDPLEPPAERLRDRVVQQRAGTGQTAELSDPGAHRAGAGDSDDVWGRGWRWAGGWAGGWAGFPIYAGTSALMPVNARPMISFWICEVPSYSVVTRASRR